MKIVKNMIFSIFAIFILGIEILARDEDMDYYNK